MHVFFQSGKRLCIDEHRRQKEYEHAQENIARVGSAGGIEADLPHECDGDVDNDNRPRAFHKPFQPRGRGRQGARGIGADVYGYECVHERYADEQRVESGKLDVHEGHEQHFDPEHDGAREHVKRPAPNKELSGDQPYGPVRRNVVNGEPAV